jgi:dethiobiotin synthetase
MAKIFVTATNTSVGKTYATVRIIETLKKLGFSVAGIKPIETGVIDTALDGEAIRTALGDNYKYRTVLFEYQLPAAPYVASGGRKIDIETIENYVQELENSFDFVVIEGAGGLMVPVNIDIFMIDLIQILESKAILIAPSNLGSINDTLLSINALKNRGIEFQWLVNIYKDAESFKFITEPFYISYFGEYLKLDEDLEVAIRRLFPNLLGK